jgi:hypothetical protein
VARGPVTVVDEVHKEPETPVQAKEAVPRC